MSSQVQLSLPSWSSFKFPPSKDPQALPPPIAGSTAFAPPFSIPPSIYNDALDVKIPITIACVYAATITMLNAYNRSRGNKPWWISTTRIFFGFVVAHNIFLAVYSGWTFVGMWKALAASIPSWAEGGLVGTVDSLCKIQGPRGLGNAVTFNSTTANWVSQSPTIFLTSAGTPDSTDAGRLWNEGLAFYGWFFYLSKFYEVLDTLIIIVKGKQSSLLQTYHHAGAMMCMWCGIRYMSPPIWMFVFVNSGIHALMYTYYTLTAFAVPIPQKLKRSLTTMQIIQFLVGASYAALHSFVSYTIPVQVMDIKSTVSVAASAASATASAVVSTATSTSFLDMLKKMLFRAVGEEGLAGNVNAPELHVPEVAPVSKQTMQYRTEYQTVPCVDTSGQTFAIWFNVLYLTPLTFLFVRFFIRSYSRRYAAAQKARKLIVNGTAGKAQADAVKGVEKITIQNGSPNGTMNGKANGKH